ncbi:MAG TPA: 50S ribosomal protein L35 [Anaerohalosphaeraceae bacterium]|jgi:large subunit ribosomal protein L35|nr:50S ribosomal protein L35 [Phycisphaerae bacterium]HOT73673.1 50S ribosomal protein L35 [Anaerohalosphaeraceae bacterium]HQG06916.1 50S ribosomal protein L35 [Anaerohalosphaeraceae bacterium]HQI08320.1 50S ribosomal protein L35 [Anaerohalosphaeraceae bacterium]HQJ68651.1 50S ribosomal protein L35 [Anaerohalosphaeraceae bacterium]
MPKLKTHKGLAKRVKVTGTGKVKRRRCGGGHLLSDKSAKRRRRFGSSTLVEGVRAKKIRILLGQ